MNTQGLVILRIKNILKHKPKNFLFWQSTVFYEFTESREKQKKCLKTTKMGRR